MSRTHRTSEDPRPYHVEMYSVRKRLRNGFMSHKLRCIFPLGPLRSEIHVAYVLAYPQTALLSVCWLSSKISFPFCLASLKLKCEARPLSFLSPNLEYSIFLLIPRWIATVCCFKHGLDIDFAFIGTTGAEEKVFLTIAIQIKSCTHECVEQ